ncbi:TonB-dependent receptor [Sphingomonas sp. CROZ-RG-20F-R02-07]|uniref:TonB-dependent receptor domain-containing protein n=1 Tax=Sphingomonas sp. CROZ-RG-20F-R02-07 TaxID=2914832 RepID=UPI001F574571|nr:TonB-dependent receptor [Sphingomonas sp. CROZ-RG-20F-R02-07]
MKFHYLLSASVVLGAIIALPTTASAQATPTTSPDSTGPGATPNQTGGVDTAGNAGGGSEAAGGGGDVVVTGSRIARPNLASPNPITSVQGEEFFQTGQVSIGDQLNQLPQLASTFSQSNSTRFLGTAGLSLLDLRNLGTQRTLVLVNGRRHVAGDILNSGTSVDVNTIPTDLIERVDVVTGGESAVYGSDAIAGVVNFVLKDHFQGLEGRAQSGVSPYGDGAAQFASILGGKNFNEGRGNIAVNVEYAHQSQYFGSDRPNLASQTSFLQVNPTGSAGNPENVLFNDVRNASYSETGVVRFGGNALLNAGTGPNGVFYYVPYQFTPQGNLVPLTGQRVGYGPNGSFIGGNGSNFRSGDEFQVQPQLDRVNVSLVGHYTFADAFEPFVEATYSHTTVFGSGSSGPAFLSGTTFGDSDPGGSARNRELIRFDNPYLTDQARATILANRTAAGLATTAATQFAVREVMEGLGNRAERSYRDTYRAVAGVRGTFNGNWRYEVSANYGEFQEKTNILGNLNIQRFLLANDTTRNAAGQVVCRSQVNSAAAYGYAGVTDPNAASVLASDVAACVPINVLGGQFTQAQKNYVLQNTSSVGKITQFDASGFVSGDLGQLFSLPGGPIGFSLGGEYRRETNSYVQDPLVTEGYTFYNSIPAFIAPALQVKEAYGEISIPLLKDLPFIKELTINGAGRVSNYNTSAGTVWSYNASAIWRPISDLTLRGSYARAVRAPNLGELYTPFGANYASVADPCSADNITKGVNPTNRQANCAAAGRPAGYNFVYSQTLLFRSGGNPNLAAETSDSYTVGGVLQPHWVPGLSITADYYSIKVNQAIASVDAQTIINQCYDLSSLSNQFCSLFQRAGASGGPRGEVPFQILEGSLISGGVNFAQLRARGIDAEIAYNHQIGSYGRISMRANYTHVFQRDDYTDPTTPGYVTRDKDNLGTPSDRFTINTEFKTGPFTFGYKVRWYGKQYVGDYAFYNSLNGNSPTDPYYANYKFYPVVAYHDLRVGIDATSKFNFYMGVTNVADKTPPLDLTGLGGGSGQYDVLGRFIYAGVVARF